MATKSFALLVLCLSLMAFTFTKQTTHPKLIKLQVVNKMQTSVKQIYLYDSEGNEIPVLSEGTVIEAGQSLEISFQCGVYTLSVENSKGQFCDYYNFDVCQKNTWELTECEEK